MGARRVSRWELALQSDNEEEPVECVQRRGDVDGGVEAGESTAAARRRHDCVEAGGERLRCMAAGRWLCHAGWW